MPKIQKQFDLEITVEQFLSACSHIELQEVDLLLDGYIRQAQQKELQALQKQPEPEISKEIGFNEDF